jgi:hypothetical protein
VEREVAKEMILNRWREGPKSLGNHALVSNECEVMISHGLESDCALLANPNYSIFARGPKIPR